MVSIKGMVMMRTILEIMVVILKNCLITKAINLMIKNTNSYKAYKINDRNINFNDSNSRYYASSNYGNEQ